MATIMACRWRIAVCLAVALAAVPFQIGDRPAVWLASAYAQDDLPSDTNEAANVLFVRALQAIAEADQTGDAASRLSLLQTAQADLDRIVQAYPGSNLAVQLVSQQRIGAFDPRDLVRDIRSAERAVARERRAAEREAASETAEMAIEAGDPLAGFASANEPWCRDNPDACALFADALATVRLIRGRRWHIDGLIGLAHAQSDAGLAEWVQRTLTEASRRTDEIANERERAETYTAISEVLALSGLFAEAQALADGMTDDVSRASALGVIAAALAEAGQAEQARSTFADAVTTAADASDRDARRPWTLAYLARMQVRAAFEDDGRGTFALATTATLDQVDGYEERFGALVEIARQQARSDLIDDMQATLDILMRVDAEASAEAIAEFRYRSQRLSWVGLTLANADYADEAQQVFTAAVTMAQAMDHGMARDFALMDLASVLARSGLHNEALQLVDDIADDWSRWNALATIARGQAFDGLIDEALAIAETIVDGVDRAKVLMDVASAHAEAGRIEEALRTFDEAGTWADTDHRWVRGSTVSALTDIASAEAAAGFVDRARQRFAEAAAMARRMDSSDIGELRLLSIAEAQASAAANLMGAE